MPIYRQDGLRLGARNNLWARPDAKRSRIRRQKEGHCDTKGKDMKRSHQTLHINNEFAIRTFAQCAEIMTSHGTKMSVRTAQQAEERAIRKLAEDPLLQAMARDQT